MIKSQMLRKPPHAHTPAGRRRPRPPGPSQAYKMHLCAWDRAHRPTWRGDRAPRTPPHPRGRRWLGGPTATRAAGWTLAIQVPPRTRRGPPGPCTRHGGRGTRSNAHQTRPRRHKRTRRGPPRPCHVHEARMTGTRPEAGTRPDNVHETRTPCVAATYCVRNTESCTRHRTEPPPAFL